MANKVLIISPRFPPTNAPDHQRVRMALPYFDRYGWKATILAVEGGKVEGESDFMLGESVSNDADVVRVPAFSATWTRKIGLGGLTYRSRFYFKPRAEELLASGDYNLIFFSTTEFPMLAWANGWRQRFGIPYVLDIQDPWVNDYYQRNPRVRRPGGFKHRLTQWMARKQEPIAIRGAGHVMCVSPGYPEMFQERYPDVPDDRFSVLPFAASEVDFETLHCHSLRQSIFDKDDGLVHWVYVGRGGDDMAFSLRCLFTALRGAREGGMTWIDRLRLHFVGTSYAAGSMAKKSVEPIAAECGVAHLVDEKPHRVPYFVALRCLLDADALVVPGSSDPTYTASKIYPYILARKPLVAIFHEQSSVVPFLRATSGGVVVTFNKESAESDVAEEIERRWLRVNWRACDTLDEQAFAPFTARAMTEKIAGCFDRVVSWKEFGSSMKQQ